MGVVVGQAGERGAQGIGVEDVETGVDFVDLEFGGRGVLGLDDADAGGVADHTPVAAGLVDLEGGGGRRGALSDVRIDEAAEQLRGEQRRVARHDQHVAGEAVERRHRAAHCVARAELVVLDDGLGVARDGGDGLGGIGRDHDDDALGAGLADGGDDPAEQRSTPDRVKHLGQRRAHARALAAGHHDAGERSISGARGRRHPGLQH